jgi:hypothetical protein
VSAPAAVLVVCTNCGAVASGTKRVAIWEEEEKGRLGARPLPLCDACHAAFLAGELSRVEIARAFHRAKGIAPHGWIGRIDRDQLLNVVCLNCGVLLDIEPGRTPPRLICPSCHTVNRLAARGSDWLTTEIER